MHICKHISSHIRLFLPYVLYAVWCLSKSYAHTNNCKKKKKLVEKKKEKIKRGGKKERKTQ
jgi:hypothetical protein